MKLNKRFNFIAAAAVVTFGFSLVHCSAKSPADAIADAIRGGFNGKPSGPDVVKQQSLSGSYASECIANPLGGMRTVGLSVGEKSSVTIETIFYIGSDCRKEDRRETLKGSLVELKSSGDVHLVKHIIPIDQNVSTWRLYNMKFVNGDVFMSDFGIEESDMKTLAPNITLKKQADAPMPVRGALSSGDYTAVSGYDKACPQNIGTATANGELFQVYVTYLPPCATSTSTLNCHSGVCESNRARLTVLSNDSYKYDNLTDNWTANFKKR